MLNKVPEITIFFWIIKILCTTVGETAADYLNTTLNFGLTVTSLIMAVLLAIALVFQFRAKKYIPTVYWLSVVLISVVGTLISDNLTDNFGVSLITTTVVFSIAVIATFILWYRAEKTLSIHSIVTTKRESFYWVAILFTFALGTAAGDLVAERFDVGYLNSIFLFGGLIAVVTIIHYLVKSYTLDEARRTSNGVLAFWLAYILTRPFGASIGDYLSSATSDGGLGLGTTVTSVIFLAAIFLLVLYLTVSKRDVIKSAIQAVF